MEVKFTAVTFRKIIRFVECWSDEFVLECSPKNIIVHINQKNISMIYLEVSRGAVIYTKKPSESITIGMNINVVKNILNFVDLSSLVKLEYVEWRNHIDVSIGKEDKPDVTLIAEVSVIPDKCVYEDLNKNFLNEASILTSELYRISELIGKFHTSVQFRYMKGSLKFLTRKDDGYPFISIDLKPSIAHKPKKIKLQYSDGRTICEKTKNVKIKDLCVNDSKIYEVDVCLLLEMVGSISKIAEFKPLYLNMNIIHGRNPPVFLSYNIPSLGVAKCYIALLIEE